MIRPLLIPALLAACANPPTPSPPPAPPASALVFQVDRGEEEALALVEDLAAACWLDHVVGGGNLLVDRRRKRFVIVSDTADLLEARFGVLEPGRSELLLDGPAAETPETARRLAETLDTANRTGETGCAPG